MELQYTFKLSGSKINDLWQQVNPNEWENMLSKHWIDKGFHFYKRIKDRGPDAGINTPSDLESEMNKGKVSRDNKDRYKVKLLVTNGKHEHLFIFYDYNDKKEMCELVTCSYSPTVAVLDEVD